MVQHDETVRRMDIGVRHKYGRAPDVGPVRDAQLRMAIFPAGAEVLFPTEEFWVPVVVLNKNVHVLPGIPSLFDALLRALPPYLRLDPSRPKPIRRLIQTSVPESMLSPVCMAPDSSFCSDSRQLARKTRSVWARTRRCVRLLTTVECGCACLADRPQPGQA